MKRNNLFKYATKELSQDAFICWLVNFAHENHNTEDLILRECAKEFLKKIVITDEELVVTKVLKQYKKIDVLLEVNNKYNIIIEDKTFTGQHGNQIERYKKILEQGEGRENIICVYYKIIEQPHEEDTDISITRSDLIELFSKYAYKTDNSIFNDYYEYLCYIDESVQRFKTEPIENWIVENDHAYKGFFTYLIKEKVIHLDRKYGWSYVANPSGGIRALWWYFLKPEELSACNLSSKGINNLYLQIEDNILTVKMSGNGEHTSAVRWSLYHFIKGRVPDFNKKTFRNGKSMTVGFIEYNEDNYRKKITLMEDVMESIARGECRFQAV